MPRKELKMQHELEDLIRQIPDRLDQRRLRELIGRYEVLRVRLIAKSECEEQTVQPLLERVRELEAQNAQERANAHEWQEWAEVNVPKHTFLLADHERLSDRVKELEIKLRRALALIPAKTDRLFQTK